MAEDDVIPNDPATDPDADEGDRRRVGPKRSEASTNAVLVAAYAELTEHGWRGFSVDRVAKTAKASKQTIYRWWKSAACLSVDAVLGTLAGKTTTLPATADVRDRLAAIIDPLLIAVRTAMSSGSMIAARRSRTSAVAGKVVVLPASVPRTASTERQAADFHQR